MLRLRGPEDRSERKAQEPQDDGVVLNHSKSEVGRAALAQIGLSTISTKPMGGVATAIAPAVSQRVASRPYASASKLDADAAASIWRCSGASRVPKMKPEITNSTIVQRIQPVPSKENPATIAAATPATARMSTL